MKWESINRLATTAAFSMGEAVTVTTIGGLSFQALAIVERDDARVVPSESGDGFYEIVDNAIGQFRTKVDLALPGGAAWSLRTQIVGAEVKMGDETFVIEYVMKRDSHHIRTLARKA